jgi:hypothetical protein
MTIAETQAIERVSGEDLRHARPALTDAFPRKEKV